MDKLPYEMDPLRGQNKTMQPNVTESTHMH